MNDTSASAAETSPLTRMRHYYEDHEERFSILLFVCGFLFDLMMVKRVDAWETIIQQFLYLCLILAVLVQMFFEEGHETKATDQMFFLKRWYYDYRVGLMHFFFGTLLNMYTIFFFKSSSLLVSFGFLVLLAFLLAANESHRFKAMGLAFKFALLSVCFLSFAACVIPIFVGYMGLLVFLLSMVVGCLPLVGIAWWVQSRATSLFERAKTQILLPMVCVLIAFLSLYMLKLIPPVPLSIPFIGVYHGVDKVNGTYQLANERPWWKIWQNGDQEFAAQKSDKIYVAFRIFSPTRFSDQVQMHWFWKDNRLGWLMQDSIPIKIIGGRAQGFRGYGVKSNYQPGEWKVQVETTDGREIGRVYFHVDIVPESTTRTFHQDVM